MKIKDIQIEFEKMIFDGESDLISELIYDSLILKNLPEESIYFNLNDSLPEGINSNKFYILSFGEYDGINFGFIPKSDWKRIQLIDLIQSSKFQGLDEDGKEYKCSPEWEDGKWNINGELISQDEDGEYKCSPEWEDGKWNINGELISQDDLFIRIISGEWIISN